MKLRGCARWALVFAGLCALGQAAVEVKTDGAHVTIRTDRYVAEFDGLALSGLENRLTGEVLARRPDKGAPTGDRTGVSIESLRPAVPVARWAPTAKSRFTVETGAQGAVITCAGLGRGEEFDEGMVVRLALEVAAETGDLVIRPSASVRIEEVWGVRDRGLLTCSIEAANLDEGLRIIVPASDGVSFTRDTVPADWRAGWRWPQFWEAALVIAESPRGCAALWADEPALRYGRILNVSRHGGTWGLQLEFETSDMIQRCTEIGEAAWRLNVFDGYWVKAAERYRTQMVRQWTDLQTLRDGRPAWADKVRIAIHSYIPSQETVANYAALVPPDSLVLFTSQGWLKGWNDGQIARLGVGMDYFPNWPLNDPTRYEAADGVAERLAAIEKAGVHTFPYTNSVIITGGNPWIAKKIHDRHFPAWKLWQRFYPELCLDVVRRYGVTGIYEDCSWVLGRHWQGTPDGESWYAGSARMRQYFRQLMPDIAVMGERNNEVTCRGQKFALSITQWPSHAHPINAYLFEPFLRMWNLQLQPSGFDADDVRGWMTPWPAAWEDHPIQERQMIRMRGLVFAREQLESYWPAAWDPQVMHYFKSRAGVEYRFVRDSGTRFVRMDAGGPETVYWRIHGVTEAKAPKAGIEGWLGYDGDTILGLNPAAVYVTLEGVRRPTVSITQIPEGMFIARCVVRDGFWLAGIAAAKTRDGKEPAPSLQTVRVRSAEPNVSFCGVESVRKLGEGEYELRATLPGGFGAYWTAPAKLLAGTRLGTIPALNTVQRRDSGLVSQYGPAIKGEVFQQQDGAPENGEEGTIAYLVTVPEIGGDDQHIHRSYLVFQYGSGHPYGDGANYFVRVNGRTVWKRYRPEQGPRNPQKPGEPVPIPLTTGAVSLEKYAGQTIVLELAADGNRTGVSESIKWHGVRLESKAPADAERDDETEAPGLPGAGAPLEPQP